MLKITNKMNTNLIQKREMVLRKIQTMNHIDRIPQHQFIAGYNINNIIKTESMTSGYLGDHRKSIDVYYSYDNELLCDELHEGTDKYNEMVMYLQLQNIILKETINKCIE